MSDGIGSAGTTPVKPSNPLWESVKEGGGYYIDKDGNVAGGPDGDGTAQTQEERLDDANSAMGDDSTEDSPDSDTETPQSPQTPVWQPGITLPTGNAGSSSNTDQWAAVGFVLLLALIILTQ